MVTRRGKCQQHKRRIASSRLEAGRTADYLRALLSVIHDAYHLAIASCIHRTVRFVPWSSANNFRAQLLCGFPCLQPFGCKLILADAVNEGTYYGAHPIGCEVE